MQILCISILKKLLKKKQQSKRKNLSSDGDSSQNSRKANNVMHKMEAKKFNISARSPDINPIENLFNYVRTKFYEESLNRI